MMEQCFPYSTVVLHLSIICFNYLWFDLILNSVKYSYLTWLKFYRCEILCCIKMMKTDKNREK